MKLMKTKSLLLALASITLVGCGGGSDTTKASENGSSSSSDKQIEVVWWNNYSQPEGDDKDTEANRAVSNYKEYFYAQDIIDAFHAENPNITIKQEYKGNYTAIYEAVKAAVNNGTYPDIVTTYQDNVAYYVDQDIAADMTEYAKELQSDSDFNQSYLNIETSIFNGHAYSLPYSKSAETFVVNNSVFEKVGEGACGNETTYVDSTTKETKVSYAAPVASSTKAKYSIPENFYEAMQLAAQMKKDFPDVFATQKDADGYYTAVPFVWDSAENMMITLLENSGIGYTDGSKTNVAEQNVWNCQEAKDLVVQLKKWNNEGLFCTQNQLYYTNVAKGYHQYSSSMMDYGKVFMCVSSTAGSSYFAETGGYTAKMNHGLNWESGSKASDAKVISQGPSLAFLNNSDNDITDAAFKFYKYLTNTENSAALAVGTSASTYFPLRTSSANSAAVKAARDAASTTVATASKADKATDYCGQILKLNDTYTSTNAYFMSDAFTNDGTGSAEIRTAVGNILTDVLNDTTATTDEAITTLVNDKFAEAYAAITK